jgi:competence protein ComEA
MAAIAVAAVVLIAVAIFSATRSQVITGEHSAEKVPSESTVLDDTAVIADTSRGKVFVHVVGAVRKPGVLELKANSRVVDAIEAAGGVAEGAALSAINLARVVTDGEQISVPTEEMVNAAAAASTAGAAGAAGGNALLNLNSADANALESLPGVGPALAGRIIDWRTSNGGFRTVDDLNQVSGIGDKLLERIRSLVSV